MGVGLFVFMFLAHGSDGDDSKESESCDFEIGGFKNGCENEADEKSENNVEDFTVLGAKQVEKDALVVIRHGVFPFS